MLRRDTNGEWPYDSYVDGADIATTRYADAAAIRRWRYAAAMREMAMCYADAFITRRAVLMLLLSLCRHCLVGC